MKVIDLLNKEDFEKIVEYYGMREQLKYFQSEVFELNEAILANRYDTEEITIDGYVEHIREEIADVMVMLKQFQYYYGIDDEQIEEIMRFKIDRQLERIKNENI